MATITSSLLKGAAPLAAILFLALPAGQAQALTMKECGEKFQAAKKDGSLKGMKWQDFRKPQCGDEDVSPDEAAAAETAPPPAASMAKNAKPEPTAVVGKV